MSSDIRKMTREQLKQHIRSLEYAVEKAKEELEARTDDDQLVYGVPVFVYDTPGSGHVGYYLYRTGPEAYDNAHRHRVVENRVAQWEHEQFGTRLEDDWESRYKVESFYMHRDWKFADDKH